MFSNGSQSLSEKARTRRVIAWALFMSATVWLSGCATAPVNPQEAVRQLAQQRWQYVLAGKYDKSYDMLVPSYRKLKSLEHYTFASKAAQVQWKSADVVRVECETNTCKVAVQVVSQLRIPTFFKGPLTSGLDETWVFEDGRWWKLETL
jgi:hypothetical protein